MHGIMPHDETRAAEVVAKVMEQDGVKLRCCGKNLLIRKQAGGIHLVVDSHGGHYDEVVDRLLLAVGRTPNVEGLNLEAAGVAYDKKGVQVNERLQTANRRIYAAGDMISEITVAIAAGAGLGTIARTIHPYPPQAEAIKKAGDAYNRTRLTPRVQKIFNTLLKWRR
jgi:pyruvate/2-oxoglutarate dehydrogenase complex dihydrolipoamide dehydrogenase (E3) component